MAEGNGSQPAVPVPSLTLGGFTVLVESGKNGDKVLVMLARNGAMRYRLPLPAEVARKVGSQLMIDVPRMEIPR